MSGPCLPHIPPHFGARRYYAWNDWVRQAHGGRLQKVSVDAGFTCPNRDGSAGRGGCSFCNNLAFTPAYLREQRDILAQLDTGIGFMRRRYPDTRGYLAYFQAYSNTYGGVAQLRELYERALSHPQVVGLAIGTRPDCLPDEVLDYLAELAQRCVLELEIGIESCDDAVLQACGRGHDFACTVDALQRAAARHLPVTGHLLLGLPGESRDSIRKGASALAQLPLAALKFHQLQVVRGSRLALYRKRDPAAVPLLELETYLDWVADVLERMPPTLRVQRLGSEVPPALRAAPGWDLRLSALPGLLDAHMRARDTWQGRLHGGAGGAS
ncbi:TIGR01212 family radical SAM protein [Uliginosibacterium sp. H1]|uniref:TIGR01212 family radical SAM protein n=1 Tax=Uliginosibacterium sp. H1 TaxID=3114757 RepID=UPI002E18B670|nr:TIGR01212 family radical SAM protein [Uliginosibacterium sp. H1]MEC5398909.1 TIGR01212 family radical SAM protein [Uliginosibacterium sp. H1]